MSELRVWGWGGGRWQKAAPTAWNCEGTAKRRRRQCLRWFLADKGVAHRKQKWLLQRRTSSIPFLLVLVAEVEQARSVEQELHQVVRDQQHQAQTVEAAHRQHNLRSEHRAGNSTSHVPSTWSNSCTPQWKAQERLHDSRQAKRCTCLDGTGQFAVKTLSKNTKTVPLASLFVDWGFVIYVTMSEHVTQCLHVGQSNLLYSLHKAVPFDGHLRAVISTIQV